MKRIFFAFLLVMSTPHVASTSEHGRPYRLVFAGDILLAREVAREIAARPGASPWSKMGGVFTEADFAMGNFEGAIGDPRSCAPPLDLCFATDPRLLGLAKQAGFTALGIANNHAGDLREAGRRATRTAISAAGLTPIGASDSPSFLRLGSRTVAILAISLVPGRDGVVDAAPSWRTAQKLRLARNLADWVIVFVHWGKELADWVVPEQQAQARWLVAHGVDVIIGSHPHMVQPPDCLDGKPVFYSLGNHVFDQKYAATKHGLIAECRIADNALSCGGLSTETPMNSSFPRPASPLSSPELTSCRVKATDPVSIANHTIRAWAFPGQITSTDSIVMEGKSDRTSWRTAPGALLSASKAVFDPTKPPMLITLERRPSPIDSETAPRPYVYDVTPQGLIARWRGSALAWPLLDASLIEDESGRSYLCALHRGDSFIMLDPTAPGPLRTQLYQWNGFGFSGVNEASLNEACRSNYAEALSSK